MIEWRCDRFGAAGCFALTGLGNSFADLYQGVALAFRMAAPSVRDTRPKGTKFGSEGQSESSSAALERATPHHPIRPEGARQRVRAYAPRCRRIERESNEDIRFVGGMFRPFRTWNSRADLYQGVALAFRMAAPSVR
jgi:hypothetical protein